MDDPHSRVLGPVDRPRVSAVIPAFNAEDYVGDAIDSVLAQTYGEVECVVVDDGSTDTTAAVARGFGPRVHLVQQENKGQGGARNSGAAAARGELLGFLDADDRWLPERIERQVDELRGRADACAVVCATEVVDRDLRPLGHIVQDHELTPGDLLLCRAALVSTGSNLLITRRCFDSVGGFDERSRGSEDWVMTFRLVQRGVLLSVDEPLVQYRVHGTNMSSGAARLDREMMKAFGRIYCDPGLPPDLLSLRRRAYANLHRMIAGAYFVEGDRAQFLRHAVSSIARHPSTLSYFAGALVRRGTGRARPQDPFAMARAAQADAGEPARRDIR